ncbi:MULTISPECIES: carbon storage regulator [unclassified Pseudomonas]|uniref:carbon storage regulator n=1 Tax=unclassified Pseudomonas TaxID=196821 RepID=UPI00244C0D9A|nr:MULTISPECIES: carbon storage regulator [unclassified Pseudomonas]MDH0894675.1 carbon storage regulator [Pseudomonas sp. GD03875]MDH1067275.1 carbon storage regulator [Pseudomonas sp. GD03985]
MGYLSLSRRDGEQIRLTIDPGVDADKLLRQLVRDGITIHVSTQGQGAVRIGIEAPKQVAIYREELLET